jgi:hypothetical protein
VSASPSVSTKRKLATEFSQDTRLWKPAEAICTNETLPGAVRDSTERLTCCSASGADRRRIEFQRERFLDWKGSCLSYIYVSDVERLGSSPDGYEAGYDATARHSASKGIVQTSR